MDIQRIKQRFEIIGNYPGLNRAIDIGLQVAPTDLSVLITGESGTGKEVFPKIIHFHSARKHGAYIAVNCGAIPEGTIDSELFGHEKGSFTGAMDSRQGYFEVANGGTIFLDEVAELPLATQVRLLRVLESGEFLRVGSSRARKTNVRVIAATNVNLLEALHNGRFREDLYYRLNTVPIHIPPLRDRTEDIPLLFRKFASDFAEKFRMPPITLSESAQAMLINYNWPGNVRQLKNITEQISVIEEKRVITPEILQRYLPDYSSTKLPALIKKDGEGDASFASEREILYKILFDMRNDVNDLKKLVLDMLRSGHEGFDLHGEAAGIIQNLYSQGDQHFKSPVMTSPEGKTFTPDHPHIQDTEEIVEESLSLMDKEVEMIKKALERHKGKRKQAAQELGISERTLYRKIKEYDLG
ncbi:MAG: sigma-54 dependent transcriptional regulator [Tenuifilaceae bacterium]|jgi:transcriptional regulator with PAS, ATPase and Fis domain|nr:sigma-54 dependent transcriptional regulator [Bacteroidales bacterium]MDI9517357.1 sigma-54 dependent transcriptional regulator [Bacteroidota bacterium]NLH56773.1 sigma-54-dependent Fis family transcriptional regulator [Rikenellaceae bacterium]OQC61377.1 MAG: Transcriptional regulatory protein QseF [Bacteroidetes bacterium ADurb.Bin008]HNS29556.1 sigma-54 dependent transcriptional regulator [Tenuifilaceae bacterium]